MPASRRTNGTSVMARHRALKPNPTHTYAQPGDYTASVTITGPGGSTASDEVDITVEEGEARAAGLIEAPPPSGSRARVGKSNDPRQTPRKRSAWIVAGVLMLFMAFVVYRSLRISGYRCSVCINFRGAGGVSHSRRSDRTEARSSAITNACAFLASGVTDSLACERTAADEDRLFRRQLNGDPPGERPVVRHTTSPRPIRASDAR